MGALLQDLRYGLRLLLRQPGFALTAILALAIGIGANTAIFSVVYSVLLRPLPYQEPSRLVMVGRTRLDSPNPHPSPTAPAVFLDWRNRNDVFADIAGYDEAAISKQARFYLTGGDAPERVWGARSTVNLFSVLGVKAALGRTFLPEEEQIGNAQVAVISDGLWRRRFGADPNLPGKTVKLNDQPYTIVGVMPSDFPFTYPQATDLWTPLTFSPKDLKDRGHIAYRSIARLKPGVTLEQARQSMNNLAAALAQEHPDTDKNSGVLIVPLHEELFGETRAPLLILIGSVGFVLLIACVNLVNLLLARSTDRAKEIAIRAALGAGRTRLALQLLAESLLLAFGGGLLGLLFALWGRDLLVTLIPADLPRSNEVAIDLWVLAFTSLLSLFTGLLFGLAPALYASKTNLTETLKTGVKSVTASARVRRWHGGLIVTEVALAMILLVGASLMIQSLWRLHQVELGFQPANILTMQFTIPRYRKLDEAQQAEFIQRVLTRIAAIPGVAQTASTTAVPMRGVDYIHLFGIPDAPAFAQFGNQTARWRSISPDYFRAMGIRLLKGRYFSGQDNRSGPNVAIISEMMARKFFAGQEPIGKRLQVDDDRYSEIIGVVGDVAQAGLGQEIEPAIYEPLAQTPTDPICLVVRAIGEPMNFTAAVQQAVWAEDKEQPLESVSTMTSIVAASAAATRFYSIVLGVFALVALSLGAMGIYGVVSYSVTRRAHEIGVRIALGAQLGDVFRLIVGQGMITVLLGVALGLAASFALSRVMQGLLYEVSSADPLTYIIVTLLLSTVALLACYLPARRAAKTDPIVALKYE